MGNGGGWFDFDRDGQLDLLATNYVQFDADHPVFVRRKQTGLSRVLPPGQFCGKFAAAFSQQMGTELLPT